MGNTVSICLLTVLEYIQLSGSLMNDIVSEKPWSTQMQKSVDREQKTFYTMMGNPQMFPGMTEKYQQITLNDEISFVWEWISSITNNREEEKHIHSLLTQVCRIHYWLETYKTATEEEKNKFVTKQRLHLQNENKIKTLVLEYCGC